MLGTQMQTIKNMRQMVESSKDPYQMLNVLATKNPRLKEVMSLINESGGDARKAFYSLAEKRGVNPDDILSMLK